MIPKRSLVAAAIIAAMSTSAHAENSVCSLLPRWGYPLLLFGGPLAAAKAKGVRFGRNTKLNEEQRQEARKRLAAGESARSIGRILGVQHATVLAVA